MHPSQVPSYFAPPGGFPPEVLYRQVRELERIWATWIPADDSNAGEALAKALVSAAAGFLEECTGDLIRTLPVTGKPARRLDNHLGWFKARAEERGAVLDGKAADELHALRNDVDHGRAVDPARLHLENIGWYRSTVADYVRAVYTLESVTVPAWL